MNYYNEIKEKLIESEIYSRVKDYSKERNKVNTYFEIGRLLSDAGKEYGKNIIKQYSEKLMIEVGKKYNERNLRYMRQFYEIMLNQNGTQCVPNYHGVIIEKFYQLRIWMKFIITWMNEK